MHPQAEHLWVVFLGSAFISFRPALREKIEKINSLQEMLENESIHQEDYRKAGRRPAPFRGRDECRA